MIDYAKEHRDIRRRSAMATIREPENCTRLHYTKYSVTVTRQTPPMAVRRALLMHRLKLAGHAIAKFFTDRVWRDPERQDDAPRYTWITNTRSDRE